MALINLMETDGGQTRQTTTAPYQNSNYMASLSAPATTKTRQEEQQVTYPTLRMGATGEEVSQLQRQLQAMGYDVGNIDGQYGQRTFNAVRQFQEDKGLDADGIAGQQTFMAMGDRFTGNIAPWAVTNEKTRQHVSDENTYVQTGIQINRDQDQKGGGGRPGTSGGGIDIPTAGVGRSVSNAGSEIANMIGQFLQQTQENPYMEQLRNMKFDYDPFKDEDYLQQAREAENQIADMMVGRG